MSNKNEVRYDRRTVKDWVSKALEGAIAITDFQRSFVWTSEKTAKYLKAIIQGKPVGLYLILQVANPPQFQPRQFNAIDVKYLDPQELVLDGQQRLTSLLHALTGQSRTRYFLKFDNLSSDALGLPDVVYYGVETTKGRQYDDPTNAYHANLVPVDALLKKKDKQGLSPLAHWCAQVGMRHGAPESRALEGKIDEFIDSRLFDRTLWYCELPISFDRRSATEIFVETNTSSVRIKRFDIEVANARGDHDDDLRNTIQDAYESSEHTALRHYFKEDPEDWIPDIGEWMLKVACLRSGHPPRETNYSDALKFLYQKGEDGTFPRMESVFGDLVWALDFVAQCGAATRRTLPSWPPVHVLAALRPLVARIKDPARIDVARQLYTAYYWRCLFSDRHDVQANDRLQKDYNALKAALNEIHESGTWSAEQPAFDDRDHPLQDSDALFRNARWIGTSSRLGRALASVVMAKQPVDWITGDRLDPNKIRELEREGDLDRHHVFSRDALKRANVTSDKIQNGLNGVVLDGKTNRRLAKSPPNVYLDKVIQQTSISDAELRKRVEQHLVKYDELKDEGPIEERYTAFLKKRAKEFEQHIQSLCKLPSR